MVELIELATANMAITCSGGKAMLSSVAWTLCRGVTASTRSVVR